MEDAPHHPWLISSCGTRYTELHGGNGSRTHTNITQRQIAPGPSSQKRLTLRCQNHTVDPRPDPDLVSRFFVPHLEKVRRSRLLLPAGYQNFPWEMKQTKKTGIWHQLSTLPENVISASVGSLLTLSSYHIQMQYRRQQIGEG